MVRTAYGLILFLSDGLRTAYDGGKNPFGRPYGRFRTGLATLPPYPPSGPKGPAAGRKPAAAFAPGRLSARLSLTALAVANSTEANGYAVNGADLASARPDPTQEKAASVGYRAGDRNAPVRAGKPRRAPIKFANCLGARPLVL
jgi:hypothetical protein